MEKHYSNLEIVKEIVNGYFIGGNSDVMKKWVAEDVVWAAAGSLNYPIAGWYHGRDKVERAFEYSAIVTKKDNVEVKEYIPHGDKVMVFGHEWGIAKPGGLPFKNDWAYYFVLHHSKVIEFREYFTFANPTTKGWEDYRKNAVRR